MSRFSGPQGRGALARHRSELRADAEFRGATVAPERRRRVRLYGCPSGKSRYSSEHDAQVTLVGAVVARNRGKAKRQECRSYLCPLCGGWHLTSTPDRAPLAQGGAA